MTYTDVMRPAEKQRALVYDVLLVLFGTLIVALSARIEVPFYPVPFTAQTFAVLFIGALYGRVRGGATLLAYLLEGAAGLPVFAGGGAGLPYLLGPTGGYLVGFMVAAFVVGMLAERGWDRRFWTTILAMVIGNLIIYLLGVTYLSTLFGLQAAIAGGLLPFLLGDALKIALAAVLLPLGWKYINPPEQAQDS